MALVVGGEPLANLHRTDVDAHNAGRGMNGYVFCYCC